MQLTRIKPLIYLGLVAVAFKIGYEVGAGRLHWRSTADIKKNKTVQAKSPSPAAAPAAPVVQTTRVFQPPSVYSNVSEKTEASCPAETDTIVIVGFGQSNSANHAGARFGDSSGKVLNYYEGKCYHARDPMLGASGNYGSLWVPLGQMVAMAKHKNVVMVTLGVGATSVNRWADEQDLRQFLANSLDTLQRKYSKVDYFVWIQGEADKGSDVQLYEDNLLKLIAYTQQRYRSSKFLMSATSYCDGAKDANLINRQKNLAKNTPGVVLIGDTDQFSAWMYRFDDCHFSQKGIEAISQEFARHF